ncbi:MAG TPA: cytochrome c [Hyphomicrobiales bacterium]|nr:cytochrome c [Rhodobiaceae bacterium]HXK53671.1 cytochrome c [Hyphomicrobiales bacterium]
MRIKAKNRRRSPRKPGNIWSVLALGFVAAGGAPSLPALAEGAVDAARGKQLSYLVRQDCGSCHGMTLKGGLGRPLLPETLAGADARTLAAIILDGIPGTPMPPWRGQIDETEAMWIARALKEGTIE